MTDIAEHIYQIKKKSDINFFLKRANEFFSSLVAIVIKRSMIWGSKCHQNNFLDVCDGYVKYEEAEADRLVAILKTMTAAAAVAADLVEYSKQPASVRK